MIHNLTKLFKNKAVEFGLTCQSTHKEYQKAYRNFLDYVHELGGWVVSQYSEEKPPYIKNYIYVRFRYRSPILKDCLSDLNHQMTIVIPEEIALRILTLNYLP